MANCLNSIVRNKVNLANVIVEGKILFKNKEVSHY